MHHIGAPGPTGRAEASLKQNGTVASQVFVQINGPQREMGHEGKKIMCFALAGLPNHWTVVLPLLTSDGMGSRASASTAIPGDRCRRRGDQAARGGGGKAARSLGGS